MGKLKRKLPKFAKIKTPPMNSGATKQNQPMKTVAKIAKKSYSDNFIFWQG